MPNSAPVTVPSLPRARTRTGIAAVPKWRTELVQAPSAQDESTNKPNRNIQVPNVQAFHETYVYSIWLQHTARGLFMGALIFMISLQKM